MTLHSVWGDSAPPGNWDLKPDGTPSIMIGGRFHLINRPTTGGVVGAKLWIPTTGGTLPTAAKIYIYANDGMDGTPTAIKEIPVTASRGSWLEVFLDELIPFPAQDFPNRKITAFFELTPAGLYPFGANVRGSLTTVPSSTQPDLVWSDWRALYKIPADTSSVPTPSQDEKASYGVDLIITDDSSWVPPGGGPEVVFGETIVEENALSGTGRGIWFDGVTSETMPAFGRSTYVEPGSTIDFSVDYGTDFTFSIYRLGHYQGNGARLVESGLEGTGVTQPAPVAIPGGNGAVTCEAWSVNASWDVPEDALPGWYYALLKGANNSFVGYVLFQVTDILAKRPVLIITGDATWHAAYNGYGSNNVYGNTKEIGNSDARALCSTYDKPVITKDYVPQTHFFNNTFPMVKWMERMGYEVAGTTVEQIKNDPSILDGRALIVIAGHNEYVPPQMYSKIMSLIANGQKIVNAAGNDFFWRVKFTSGAFDAGNGRVMWCKKDTMNGPNNTGHVAGQPFTTQEDWTGTWQDTRYENRVPSSLVFGDRFIANGVRNDQLKVPNTSKDSPVWRQCPGIQALGSGQSYSFVNGSLGMEWDMPVESDNAYLEQIKVSSTTVQLNGVASDINGEQYNLTETAEHAITVVKNQQGYILNLNSDQWSWTLDALHLRGSAPADVNAMQMMLNVIRDFGVSAHSASITGAGLVVPTPVALSAYGFTVPLEFTAGKTYYSDGTTWTELPVSDSF